MRNPLNVERYVDKKLDQISGAGNLFGHLVGSIGRHASKVVIGAGILLIFGFAIFLWSLAQGMRKKNK
jgi:hypothetical protein